MSTIVSVSAAARLDRGLVRETNQDVVVVGDWVSAEHGASLSVAMPLEGGRGGFAVVDGMGGHSGGDVAAWLTAHVLVQGLSEVTDASRSDSLAQRAHALVSDAGAGIGHPAMGAAFAAVIADVNGYAVLNVGDCRVYRVLADRTDLLSVDDTAPSRHDPAQTVLTQSIGGGRAQRVETHFYDMTWAPGVVERFVLCSDGLMGDVENAIRRESPEESAEALIDAALRAGAPDNVSVVVLDFVVTEAE